MALAIPPALRCAALSPIGRCRSRRAQSGPDRPRTRRAQSLHPQVAAQAQSGGRQLQEAGERLFTFRRLPPSQCRSARTTNAIERLHEEFKRRIKTQTVLPSADTAAMLWALLASGQINMRKVDGWQTPPPSPWIRSPGSNRGSISPHDRPPPKWGALEALLIFAVTAARRHGCDWAPKVRPAKGTTPHHEVDDPQTFHRHQQSHDEHQHRRPVLGGAEIYCSREKPHPFATRFDG